MALKIGDKAPDFTLFNQDGEPVTLSSFKGRNVVVLFFPAANTGACTTEMCTFRVELKDYENLNAQVLGISVDTHFALKMFHEKNNYNFPLLSDFNKKVIKDYDVVVDATDNVATRYLLNDACVLLGKALVSGGALGTNGQITVYNDGNGKKSLDL